MHWPVVNQMMIMKLYLALIRMQTNVSEVNKADPLVLHLQDVPNNDNYAAYSEFKNINVDDCLDFYWMYKIQTFIA